MFLVDIAEFNVSKHLPKIPLNVRSRKIAAELLREGRKLEKVTNRYKKTTRPSLVTLHAVSPSVLIKNGVNLKDFDESITPDYSKLMQKNRSKERTRIKDLGETNRAIIKDITPSGDITFRRIPNKTLYSKSGGKSDGSDAKLSVLGQRVRMLRVANDSLLDADYRRVLRSMYKSGMK